MRGRVLHCFFTFTSLLSISSAVYCAWPYSQQVSDATSETGTKASLKPGSGGTMHLVYHTQNNGSGPSYEVRYRKRNVNGSWTPLEKITSGFYSARADVIEDSGGRVIVVTTATLPGGANPDICWRYKDGGGWHPTLDQLP